MKENGLGVGKASPWGSLSLLPPGDTTNNTDGDKEFGAGKRDSRNVEKVQF